MLQGGFRIGQVGKITIGRGQESQVAHPGQNEAKQEVPFGFASLP